MGAVHRVCKGETVVVGFVAFFVGIAVGYIAAMPKFYSGHGEIGGHTAWSRFRALAYSLNDSSTPERGKLISGEG